MSTLSIENIIKTNDNHKCVDCGTEKIIAVSVNNSVFICDKCFGIHNEINDDSISKPVLISNGLTDKDLIILNIGGNKRFISNLLDYEIIHQDNLYSNDDEIIKSKYYLNALQYYRNILIAEIDKKEKPKKPTLEQGQDTIKSSKTDEENGKENKKKNLKEKATIIFTSAVNKAKVAAGKVNEKLEKHHVKEKIKNASDKTASLIKKAGKYVKEKTIQVATSDKVQNGVKKVKGFFEGKNTQTES